MAVVPCIWECGWGILELCRLSTTHSQDWSVSYKVLTPQQIPLAQLLRGGSVTSAAWVWKLNDPGDEVTIYCLGLCLERAVSCWPLSAPTGATAMLMSSALNLKGESTNHLPGIHYYTRIQWSQGNFTFSFHFQNFLLMWIKYDVFPSTAWCGIWWTFQWVFVIRAQPFTLFAGVIRDRTHLCFTEAWRQHVCICLVSLETITESTEEKLSRIYLAARVCHTGIGRAETAPVLASDWHLWWHWS